MGDFYFASHCFSGNNQEHPREGRAGSRREAEVHSFQSPSEYSFETRNDGQHRRDKLAGRHLAYSTMTHNERISVHEDFLLKGPPPPCVCLYRSPHKYRSNQRTRGEKQRVSSIRGTFFSPIGEYRPTGIIINRRNKKILFLSILISNII